MLENFHHAFDHLIVLDVETTGLNPKTDEIIELGGICLQLTATGPQPAAELNMLIHLSPGRELTPFITDLTGISPKLLEHQGLDKATAAERLARLLDVSRPLVAAYNAQFDLCFLYYFLQKQGKTSLLQGIQMLDALTVYRDRRDYPHKLKDAITAYELPAENTHRAIDDARAAFELLGAMEAERDDLSRYINLFGFNPRYGEPRPRIASITYRAQNFDRRQPLYAK